MYYINYRFWAKKKYPFQNFSLTFILKSFLFLAGTRLRIAGEKREKKSAWAWQKKTKQNKSREAWAWQGGEKLALKKLFVCRGPTGQERVTNLKNVCGEGGKGWRPPITLSRPPLSSLHWPIFFLFDQVFPPLRSLVPGFLIFRVYKQ